MLSALLACTASGLALYAGERSAARQGAENRRAELQAQLKGALAQDAGLPALRRHEGELAMRLSAAEDALWPDSDDTGELLQAKLARRAAECGLTVESLRPLAAQGNAVPSGAEIGLRGEYTQLLRFTELVTAAPWPVLLDTMEIVRDERDATPALLMNARLRVMARSEKIDDGEKK
jgi:Tfp pilus assembly protein PilO